MVDKPVKEHAEIKSVEPKFQKLSIPPKPMVNESYRLVVAIDFGTAYSGYAFSLREEFEKQPLLIFGKVWESGTYGLSTTKTPTVILLNPDGKFDSFGYKAESQYATLLEDEGKTGVYKKWFFFKHFKMTLYQEMKKVFETSGKHARNITRRLMITSENGNKMAALTVFSEAIRFMVEQVKRTIQDSYTGNLSTDDVRWVLTVPAIWSEQAKQFMREAAKMAGVPEKQLILALEPEAAAIYCKQKPATMENTTQGKHIGFFSTGEKFMTLDCGGGTVDVTVHEVLTDGHLAELCAPSGGPWGGTYVDKEFIEFLIRLLGDDSWKNFQSEYPADLLEMKRKFEVKKRYFEVEGPPSDKVAFTEVSNLLKSYRKICKTALEKRIACDDVDVYKSRLRLSNKLMQSFFKSSVDSIIAHLDGLFSSPEIQCVKSIYLVGGYSEADALTLKIKKHFSTKEITVPPDGSLAVLKGAVIFGHNNSLIRFRKSKFSYGISTSVKFDERKHLPQHQHLIDGKIMCSDVFSIMVRKDQILELGRSSYENLFNPSRSDSTIEEIEIYYSTEDEPMYTTETDSCKRLGVITYNMPMPRKENTKIKVQIHFDFTEIKVTVTEDGSGNPVYAKFDCLA